jgi:hypothetical protein
VTYGNSTKETPKGDAMSLFEKSSAKTFLRGLCEHISPTNQNLKSYLRVFSHKNLTEDKGGQGERAVGKSEESEWRPS